LPSDTIRGGIYIGLNPIERDEDRADENKGRKPMSISGKVDPVVRPVAATDVAEAFVEGLRDFQALPLMALPSARSMQPAASPLFCVSPPLAWPISPIRWRRVSR
jgi:hypothetical protein